MTDHKPGCPANGGYGHGKEDCICGADAKPVDVGALVKEIEFTMPPNKDMACGYDELLDRCRTALLALQAEVARLTRQNDDHAAYIAGIERELDALRGKDG